MFTDCSTSTTAVPSRLISRTMSSSWPTITGASPSDSSSMSSSRGRRISALERPSICCSPPDSVLAFWLRRSASRGNAVEAALDRRVDRAPVAAERVAEHAQVLDDVHRPEHGPAAGDLRDAEPQPALGVEVGDVGAAEADAARRRQADAGDHLQQRRLAGAVRAEQRDHLAVVDGEVDVEQHLQLAVGEVDACGTTASAACRPVAVIWRISSSSSVSSIMRSRSVGTSVRGAAQDQRAEDARDERARRSCRRCRTGGRCCRGGARRRGRRRRSRCRAAPRRAGASATG